MRALRFFQWGSLVDGSDGFLMIVLILTWKSCPHDFKTLSPSAITGALLMSLGVFLIKGK